MLGLSNDIISGLPNALRTACWPPAGIGTGCSLQVASFWLNEQPLVSASVVSPFLLAKEVGSTNGSKTGKSCLSHSRG